MVHGIGIDIVDISRVRPLIVKMGSSKSRVFTDNEMDYIMKRKAAGEMSAAGIFAAKEAFAKAMGTGVSGFSFKDVEISHDENGMPKILLYGGAKKMAEGLRLFLTISHEKEYAVAMVLAEKS